MLMPATTRSDDLVSAEDMRRAMRSFAGTVCIIAVDGQHGRTGCAATSVNSLSVDPPVLVFSLMGGSSTARALHVDAAVGVSLLAPVSQPAAQRFSGFGGATGEARFGAERWTPRSAGALTLDGALVEMGCIVEEVIRRHRNLLVLARVQEIRTAETAQPPLMYWNGDYRAWC